MASKRTLGFSLTALRKKFRAGMTVRNYLSKFMNTFRKKGFVRYNGGGLQINSALITGFLQSRPMSVATKA